MEQFLLRSEIFSYFYIKTQCVFRAKDLLIYD